MNRNSTSGHRPPRAGLLRLFPHAWRRRYEAEFLALIEERPPGPRDLADILASALDARLRPRAWNLDETPERGLVAQSASGPPLPPPGTRLTVGGNDRRRNGAEEREERSRRFTRREFLRNAVLGSAGAAAIVAAGGAILYFQPEDRGPLGTEVQIPTADIPPPGAAPYEHRDGQFWLINNDDGALALYWKCTHLNCRVPWEEGEGRFHCPCHASIYDRQGVRVEGPAPRPLDLMHLRVDETGNVFVHTGRITRREEYDPSQTVQLPTT